MFLIIFANIGIFTTAAIPSPSAISLICGILPSQYAPFKDAAVNKNIMTIAIPVDLIALCFLSLLLATCSIIFPSNLSSLFSVLGIV